MLYPDFSELIGLGGRRVRLELGSNHTMLSGASGSYNSPFRGQGLTFHEVREYRLGDDIRNIDWRVTARTNKPHMKVFTEDRERTVMLCIDANATMRFGTRGTFKSIQAAHAVSFLGWLANKSHDQVGCAIFGDVPEGLKYFKPMRSRRALWQALKLLSLKKTGAHATAVPVESVMGYLDKVTPTGALVFIISDFSHVTPTLEKSLRSLRRRCDVVLLRIEDPADGIIPPIGSIRFSDLDGQTFVVDTDDRVGQDAYAGEAQRTRVKLEDICVRGGIGMIALHTDGNLQDDLMLGLRRLALGR
jgi:uncharacterized protein (DUF58 family)